MPTPPLLSPLLTLHELLLSLEGDRFSAYYLDSEMRVQFEGIKGTLGQTSVFYGSSVSNIALLKELYCTSPLHNFIVQPVI